MSRTAPSDDGLALFEAQRARLSGLAYRMLGSRADAEDAVQEAWLRWRETDVAGVQSPRAFLTQIVTRLCLDRLKSAQAQREVYVGPWLPEPVVEDAGYATPGPEAASELASDLSFAFLLALERLSPLERAAFLLHDVFDQDFAEVAQALGRTPSSCRQLATRARTHIQAARPRYRPSADEVTRLGAAFLQALGSGNTAQLTQLLTADAVFHSDGGGKVRAALRPIRGGARVAEFMFAVMRSHPLPRDARLRPARVNGLPGFVLQGDGGVIQTLALDYTPEGLIQAIYVVRNPEKLKGLAPES